MTNYRSIDDLLAESDDADRRRSFEGEDWGELIASGRMDEDDYAVDAWELEREEARFAARRAEALKTPEQKAQDAAKKQAEQNQYDYVNEGIIRDGFVPTDRDVRKREELLAHREKMKDVPFPYEK